MGIKNEINGIRIYRNIATLGKINDNRIKNIVKTRTRIILCTEVFTIIMFITCGFASMAWHRNIAQTLLKFEQ